MRRRSRRPVSRQSQCVVAWATSATRVFCHAHALCFVFFSICTSRQLSVDCDCSRWDSIGADDSDDDPVLADLEPKERKAIMAKIQNLQGMFGPMRGDADIERALRDSKPPDVSTTTIQNVQPRKLIECVPPEYQGSVKDVTPAADGGCLLRTLEAPSTPGEPTMRSYVPARVALYSNV